MAIRVSPLKMKAKKKIVVMAAAVTLIALCAIAVQWQVSRQKLVESRGLASGNISWGAVSCRLHLFFHKMQGKIPELSWLELWQLASERRTGFHCAEGRSLESALQFSSSASTDDRRLGAVGMSKADVSGRAICDARGAAGCCVGCSTRGSQVHRTVDRGDGRRVGCSGWTLLIALL